MERTEEEDEEEEEEEEEEGEEEEEEARVMRGDARARTVAEYTQNTEVKSGFKPTKWSVGLE